MIKWKKPDQERKAELERRQKEEEERKKSKEEENPETVGKTDNELLREIEVRIYLMRNMYNDEIIFQV